MSAGQTDKMGTDHFGSEHGSPTLVIAHGILGSRRNWRSFARQLSVRRPDCSIWTVDLRAHGDSRALGDADTIAACADDIVTQFSATPEVVLVGHSFGGKVMCAAAAKWPRPLRQLWILDSALGDRESSFGGGDAEVESVLQAALAIPAASLDRSSAAKALEQAGFGSSLVAWMLTNVVRTSEGHQWRFDPERVQRLLHDYFQRDLWPIFAQPRAASEHILVRGELSARWSKSDLQWLNRATHRTDVHDLVLPGAGHWLHADNPQGLLQLFDEHLYRDATPS